MENEKQIKLLPWEMTRRVKPHLQIKDDRVGCSRENDKYIVCLTMSIEDMGDHWDIVIDETRRSKITGREKTKTIYVERVDI